ncbi:MAG: 50S ribosomal protein L25/general stress protein Ctc, partial [Enterococcus sp.]
IGDSISIGDLPKNADYTIVTDAEEQIASIQEAQEVPEEEPAAEGAEPEVIGEDAAE